MIYIMKENNVEYIEEGYFDGLEIYISVVR